jgi:hypothetical protein
MAATTPRIRATGLWARPAAMLGALVTVGTGLVESFMELVDVNVELVLAVVVVLFADAVVMGLDDTETEMTDGETEADPLVRVGKPEDGATDGLALTPEPPV